MNQQIETNEEKVAVGCLSCYNEGRLTFKWMNAEQLTEAHEIGLVKSVCDRVTCGDEWHIQDYDGHLNAANLGEWPDIEQLIMVMELVDADPHIYAVAVEAAYDRYQFPDATQIQEVAEMMFYLGDQSIEDYFRDWAYEVGDMVDGSPMESYIDWKHYARDQMYHYTEYMYGGEIYLLPDY